MSRIGGVTVLGLLAFAVSLDPVRAEEVYRWTDEDGTVHYSNVGAPDDSGTDGVQVEDFPGSERAPADAGTGRREASPGDEERSEEEEESSAWADLSDQEFSTMVSQTRRDLQRQVDRKQDQIAEIDGELAEIQSAQEQARDGTGRFQGQPKADPVESDEAEELRSEREEVERELAELRQRYEELREEAVSRYGSLPSWWLPLR